MYMIGNKALTPNLAMRIINGTSFIYPCTSANQRIIVAIPEIEQVVVIAFLGPSNLTMKQAVKTDMASPTEATIVLTYTLPGMYFK